MKQQNHSGKRSNKPSDILVLTSFSSPYSQRWNPKKLDCKMIILHVMDRKRQDGHPDTFYMKQHCPSNKILSPRKSYPHVQ
mmetsp:Transcript_16059/g.21309  ORF Transcript_16059/g.21309 Transcript_16059/m.21309 type:complete len:81 (+) Transcript_16059:97-339(+)